MRIVAISDLHGSLPEIPECDLLLIGGDVCPVDNHSESRQREFLTHEFLRWLDRVPAEHIVGIAGNHDFIFETNGYPDLPWTYLKDEAVEVAGLWIYGTPWVPNLPSWAFFGGMEHNDDEKIARIPEGMDILLSHGPMRGYGDKVASGLDVGCTSMAAAMERLHPRVFVCGHIHEARGHYSHKHVEHGVFNVSHMTEYYDPTGAPVVLPLP